MDSFTALADPTRREIVELLAESGELAASEISQQFEMTAPAISQHLKVLRESHILRMKKQAQKRIYSINPEGIQEMETWIINLRALWEERFDRLDAYLEEIQQEENQ